MAAPTGPRGSQVPSEFEGFPFPMASRPPEDSSGKEQEQTGDVKKKPCRACTDFKSWVKMQKKQATTASGGTAQVTQWSQAGNLTNYFDGVKFMMS